MSLFSCVILLGLCQGLEGALQGLFVVGLGQGPLDEQWALKLRVRTPTLQGW